MKFEIDMNSLDKKEIIFLARILEKQEEKTKENKIEQLSVKDFRATVHTVKVPKVKKVKAKKRKTGYKLARISEQTIATVIKESRKGASYSEIGLKIRKSPTAVQHLIWRIKKPSERTVAMKKVVAKLGVPK